ncbi:glycosyltransferase family 4 protein [Magnetospirillum sp. UT-4]|uniref:glycosyltransferase family 4 protein n=1 Tax=Magnetospirillum sp. UT-4 TaxID=2681467 RepID=UPI001382A54D|nr:glycosyltransferase family 4 protein [Magnetospirillum sp. UT-4]CAA7618848.1 putative Glycosyltransferase [Magnetospirillum sp. UT-4]
MSTENSTAIEAPAAPGRQPPDRQAPDRQAPDRQPVVLQVLPALVTGGVERGTVEVAQALVEAGWTSIVASSGGPMVRELTRVGAEHVEMPLASKKPWDMRANVGRLEALIRERGVDIVHARSRAPAWSALAAANRTGAHFLTTFHGTYNLGWFGLKHVYNSVMTRGERVIAISDFIAEHARRIYGVDAARIRVIHRGVDLRKFDPVRVSPERIIQLAHRWRLPDGFPVIMLPGRLTRWKGQEVLIRALAELGRHDVRCLLVGSDQGRTGYRQDLVNLIRKLDLVDVVHIVDECNDMPAAYMLTDIAVSASTDPEAFGRVVVEAQAMGRPVIATDHGGARETILPGRTGWLVTPGDPSSLASALARFLTLTAEERGDMAVLAQSFVRENFTREAMCAKTLAVYRDVLAGEAEAETD